jgi:methionine synthase I (cobalamin-dependent)
MAQNFIERLKQAPVLCDGAMGTLLYARGIFINRCYDELNLSQPELIRAVHHDYLQAGAEIIETNTFGANSFRLARHSLADRVRDINLAGASVAHEAAKSFDVWVAGSVGPLGVRIEPLGKTAFEEARAAFRQQIEALVEGGVDLLMLETFGYVEELHQAVLACPRRKRQKFPSSPRSPSTKTATASMAPTPKPSRPGSRNGMSTSSASTAVWDRSRCSMPSNACVR